MEKDRRKFMRFEIPLDVEFKKSNDVDSHSTGTTINFSRSGLCFETDNLNYDLNDLMKLEVKLPKQDSYISVTGKIAWKKEFDSKCLAGIIFREIDSEAKSNILDHAYNAWLSNMKK